MYKIKLRGLALGVIGSLFLGFNVYAESYATVKQSTANIIDKPSIQSSVIKEVEKDETVKVIKQIEDWYEVEIDESLAYIEIADVDVFKVKAEITEANTELRVYPGADEEVIRKFDKGKVLSVLYKVGDWYKVSMSEDPVVGFIHESKVEDPLLYMAASKDIEEVERIELAKEVKQVAENSRGQQAVEYARKFIGNPYRYGGNSLTSGVDCSGFTQQVMKSMGVSISRSSAAQYANSGVKVSINDLQPGDLMFYGYNGRVSHVGLYAGNGQIIHASTSRTGVTTGDAYRRNGRGKPLIGAKRVL